MSNSWVMEKVSLIVQKCLFEQMKIKTISVEQIHEFFSYGVIPENAIPHIKRKLSHD